jgi:hypothetical protein
MTTEIKKIARLLRTAANLKALVAALDDDTLRHLAAESYHEDARRFDERCDAHPASVRRSA